MQLRKEIQIYEFHIFIVSSSSFPGILRANLMTSSQVALLAQLVRALHRYRRGQGSNPGKPDFFRLSFRNCISCVNNCEDLLYTYFIPQFKIYEFHLFIVSSSSFPGILRANLMTSSQVGLLAQLVRALHRYRRGQGSNPGKPVFSGFLFATA